MESLLLPFQAFHGSAIFAAGDKQNVPYSLVRAVHPAFETHHPPIRPKSAAPRSSRMTSNPGLKLIAPYDQAACQHVVNCLLEPRQSGAEAIDREIR